MFVFCESEWVTHLFVSSTLRDVLLSFFALLSLFLCHSVFDLLCLLLRCPVLASLLRVFFFLSFVASPTVGYLSFSLVVVQFSCVSFLSLGVAYSFGGLPCLLHTSPLSVVLTSSLLRLLILSFIAVGSGMLSSPLCSPFFATMALPCASSGFPVFTCSVLLPLSFRVLFLVCLFA